MKPLTRMILRACLLLSGLGCLTAPAAPVRVYILAGQSNMEGKAKISLLETQIKDPGLAPRFAHLHKDGTWVERDDVFIKFLDRKGPLTVGYGSRNCVGPELEFGWAVGDRFEEPVLLIKTAWGGKSLYRDFRPPSAGLPDAEALNQLLANQQKRKPDTTLEQVKEGFGFYYREMLQEVRSTLSDLDTLFPELKGRTPELCGFVWFQGWNDMINESYTAEYASNMAHFIRDVRKDLQAPGLPFVIGQMGVDGMNDVNPKQQTFRDAQAQPASLPEFKGNVWAIPTGPYWDTTAHEVFKKGWKQHLEEWNKLGSDYPYHYLGSHLTYGGIGKALAQPLLK